MEDQLTNTMEALDLSKKADAVPAQEAPVEEKDDDFVDPWNVVSKSDKGVDYDKLISKLLRLMKQPYQQIWKNKVKFNCKVKGSN